MESRHDVDSLIETIETLRWSDASNMIKSQKEQLAHISFNTDTFLKAAKIIGNTYGKLPLIIENFPVYLGPEVDKLISILQLVQPSTMALLIAKLKAANFTILLAAKDFIKLLKKVGYDKVSPILSLLVVDVSSLNKPKIVNDFLLEVFTYGISNYKDVPSISSKNKKNFEQCVNDIATINDINLNELLRIVEPVLAQFTSCNQIQPLFANFYREGVKYNNEILLMGDSHFRLKCALRARLQHLITTQHELNELVKLTPEKMRGGFTKTQHDYWAKSQVAQPSVANNNNALFNQAAPSAPPAKEVAPEYLAPPVAVVAEPTPVEKPNDNNVVVERTSGGPTCCLM